MQLNEFNPIGVKKNESFTIPWKDGATTPENSLKEIEAREVLDQYSGTTNMLIECDNYTSNDPQYSSDLDPTVGRLLEKYTDTDSALQGKQVDAAVDFRYDPTTKEPKSLDIVSEQNNITKHVQWENGQLQSSHDERVLADGSHESVTLLVDSKLGTLTYNAAVGQTP